MIERTVEQLNQTPLSQTAKELLNELGVFPKPEELYLIQYLREMTTFWEAYGRWEEDNRIPEWAVYGVGPLYGNAYNLTPEQQYRVMTNNLGDEEYLLSLMETSLEWHRQNPNPEEWSEALWEDAELLSAMFEPTADNLEMQIWNEWEEAEDEE